MVHWHSADQEQVDASIQLMYPNGFTSFVLAQKDYFCWIPMQHLICSIESTMAKIS